MLFGVEALGFAEWVFEGDDAAGRVQGGALDDPRAPKKVGKPHNAEVGRSPSVALFGF